MKLIDVAVAVALMGAISSPIFVAASQARASEGVARASEGEPNIHTVAAASALGQHFRAPDNVQKAIYGDVCSDDLVASTLHRSSLGASDRRWYDRVLTALTAEYNGTHGTDGELDAVWGAFCEAAGDV